MWWRLDRPCEGSILGRGAPQGVYSPHTEVAMGSDRTPAHTLGHDGRVEPAGPVAPAAVLAAALYGDNPAYAEIVASRWAADIAAKDEDVAE